MQSSVRCGDERLSHEFSIWRVTHTHTHTYGNMCMLPRTPNMHCSYGVMLEELQFSIVVAYRLMLCACSLVMQNKHILIWLITWNMCVCVHARISTMYFYNGNSQTQIRADPRKFCSYLWFVAIWDQISGTPAVRADPRECTSRIVAPHGAHHFANFLVGTEYYGTWTNTRRKLQPTLLFDINDCNTLTIYT